jgi:DNA-binding GntR family transcriptional regulator
MPGKIAAEKESHGELATSIYVQVKADLVACSIAPGQEFFEGQLAGQYGVSKSPVREALQRLVRERFVEVRPRRGYVAAPITLNDVQEVFRLRLLLEPEAAELAALHATDQQVLRLRELAAQHRPNGASGRGQAWDRAFHAAIAEAAGNQRLLAMLRTLNDELARIFNALAQHSRIVVPPSAHQDLVEAIAQRDVRRARQLRLRGIRASQRAVINSMVAQSAARPRAAGR